MASEAALTINNQLKVATAAATETATMTATTMTMETKATASTCCCLRRRRRQRRAIAKLPPPPPSWQLPTRCRRASAAPAAFGRTAGGDKKSSGRCNQQPPLPQRRFVGIDGGCEHYLPFHQPHSDDLMPDANHQQIWLIALHVAQPPPICLVPLHPNTMGDAANVRLCQNHWWGRVIGGVLPM